MIEPIVKRLLWSMHKRIDDSCTASLNHSEEYPALVGIPLEIIDNDQNGLLTLTPGNMTGDFPSRLNVNVSDVEIFYSESVIASAFTEDISIFLDKRLVSEYNNTDIDANYTRYEDF
jgi:hypothetical protein